jgi:hypothetical protein
MRREIACTLLLLAACGDDAPTDVDSGIVECTTPLADRYLPLVVGASWTYDTSDMGSPVVQKTTAFEAFEDVGDRKAGVMAFRQRTEKVVGHSISWHSDDCTAVTRHREQSFDSAGVLVSDQFYVPGKLRVDESAAHTMVGATWTTAYTEVEVDPVSGTQTVSKDETWTVEAVDESVTVPAGTFTALRIRKTTSGDADKTYWFVKGVGKVKEAGEQTEDLTAYTIPGLP